MSLPKIIYDAGAGAVTLQFVRGPAGVDAGWAPVVHDNVSSDASARERVVENKAILISFTMPALIVSDDLTAWMAFFNWAIGGGAFKFYPNAAMTGDWYNCVDEMGTWSARRRAPGVYSADFKFRVLMDGQAPANPGVVLQRLMGVA